MLFWFLILGFVSQKYLHEIPTFTFTRKFFPRLWGNPFGSLTDISPSTFMFLETFKFEFSCHVLMCGRLCAIRIRRQNKVDSGHELLCTYRMRYLIGPKDKFMSKTMDFYPLQKLCTKT